MKMERQAKYRQEQQQADQTETLEGSASEGECGHNPSNTQVCFPCQSEAKQYLGKLSIYGRV
jgi:hypothetical protein